MSVVHFLVILLVLSSYIKLADGQELQYKNRTEISLQELLMEQGMTMGLNPSSMDSQLKAKNSTGFLQNLNAMFPGIWSEGEPDPLALGPLGNLSKPMKLAKDLELRKEDNTTLNFKTPVGSLRITADGKNKAVKTPAGEQLTVKTDHGIINMTTKYGTEIFNVRYVFNEGSSTLKSSRSTIILCVVVVLAAVLAVSNILQYINLFSFS